MSIYRLILTIGLLLSPVLLKGQGASPVSETVSFSLLPASNQLAGESYDANGNQTSDSVLGIVSVKYNLLNLPEVVTYSDSTKVYYLYSASGSKLKEVVVPGGDGETETTDYTGNLIYKNGTLHKVLTNGGYIETGDSTLALLNRPAYRYFLTDHLGSVRVVADAQGHVLQQNSQLPYGEDYTPVYASGHAQGGGFTPLPGEPPTGGGSGSGYDEEFEDEGEDGETSGGTSTLEPDSYYRSYNPYKFSGKEQIKSGHYDFGARWYSPRTARWSTQDPLAEKYHSISPYAYCAGNPINLVDPNGMNWYSYADSTGTTQYKYVEGQLSEEEIKSNNYKDLGYTHREGNMYYSLFGIPYEINRSTETKVELISSIDRFIINYIANDRVNPKTPFDTEYSPAITDFSNVKTSIALQFKYQGLSFSSMEDWTMFFPISTASYRGQLIEGDPKLQMRIFVSGGKIPHGGLNQNEADPMIEDSYWIIGESSKKSSSPLQIRFDRTGADAFLKSVNNIFGTSFSIRKDRTNK